MGTDRTHVPVCIAQMFYTGKVGEPYGESRGDPEFTLETTDFNKLAIIVAIA
jgi:hypothetical protein